MMTQYGLGRKGSGVGHYDGTNWTVYNTSNSGLPSNTVDDIAVDRNGTIWFATRYGGIANYDGSTWTIYNTSNSGLPSNSANGIANDSDGSHWFGTDAGIGVLWILPTNLIQENPVWQDEMHFQVSFEITSLIPRGNYRISTSVAIGTDGIEIVPSSTYTFTVDYAGGIGDTTPPYTPELTACAGDTPDTITASWIAYDPDSQITLYEYAIGTSPGMVDVVNWTTTSESSFKRNGLVLVPGQVHTMSRFEHATKVDYGLKSPLLVLWLAPELAQVISFILI